MVCLPRANVLKMLSHKDFCPVRAEGEQSERLEA